MSELKDYDIMDIEAMDDERLEKSESGKIQVSRVYLKSEADKVIAHQKYKRCLAMKWWCASRAVVWDIDGNEKKSNWYWKWKERWKRLAEKFKPNNSTAQ